MFNQNLPPFGTRLANAHAGKTPKSTLLDTQNGETKMTFSVNTNAGALIALQYLTATQGQLNQTQSHINSGMKVATARDDGAIYAIAQNQRGQVAGYTAVLNSINNATSSVDVALSAGQSISDLLIQLKTKALSAADSSLDTASRQALNANFTALRDQISTIVKNAVFNGFNLVDGSTNQITALASADGSRRITTAAQNMKLSGSIVTMTTTATISTQAKASTLVATIQASLTNVNSALAKLSSGAAKFSIQGTFSQKLSDTLTQGIGNLVDANMAQESAMLQSLQVKQQLGVQALSIANQAPQTILSLFR
jgi:flagellin